MSAPATRSPHVPAGPRTQAASRRALVGLASLFFAPLALAFLVYYGTGGRWHPSGHVNHGTLIDPARPTPPLRLPQELAPLSAGAEASAAEAAATGGSSALAPGARLTPADFLEHRWSLLYVGRADCGAACQRALYDTRQVRLALNRDMSRVQRVFLAEGEGIDAAFLRREHPDLLVVRAGPEAEPLRRLLPGADRDRVYLIDPLGNLMMWYGPDGDPKGMLIDLKRLLGLSHVG